MKKEAKETIWRWLKNAVIYGGIMMTKAEEIRDLIQYLEISGDYNIVLIRAIGEVIIDNQAKDLITISEADELHKMNDDLIQEWRYR